MKKLRLQPEDLAVTSFEVDADQIDARGTIEAQEFVATGNTRCNTCYTCYTICLPYC